MTPTDPKKAEEVALFRTYLTSKLAADMQEWWYVHWAMDEDDTNAAALELALILKLNQGGLPVPCRFLDRCPIFYCRRISRRFRPGPGKSSEAYIQLENASKFKPNTGAHRGVKVLTAPRHATYCTPDWSAL